MLMVKCVQLRILPIDPFLREHSELGDDATAITSSNCSLERLHSGARRNRICSRVDAFVVNCHFVGCDKVIAPKKGLVISQDFASTFILDDAIARGNEKDVEHLVKVGVGDTSCEYQAA